MKKVALSLCLALLSGIASADELAEAQKLWDSKKFTAAFQAFDKLARAGNPAAQVQLGEMYGFGEGTPENLALATEWLEKATRAGNGEAATSLALVRRRAAHKADIQWYVARFDGADARYEKFGCRLDELPLQSRTNAEIKAINAAIQDWRACYGRFAANLNSKAQVQNTIPADVLDLLNNDEFVAASDHIATIYSKIAADAQRSADATTAAIDNWKAGTERYIASLKSKQLELNALNDMNGEESKRLIEITRERAADAARKRTP